MPISEENKIKNNADLTQHFLYTYSNFAKTGPRESTRLEFNEDLIFDRSRKSIFTQSQEFGYVSDTVYTLSVGNEQNNGESQITLRSYEGNIEFYKFNPLVITSVDWSVKKDIYLKYDKFTLNSLDFTYVASGKITYLEILFNGTSVYSTNNFYNDEGTGSINGINQTLNLNTENVLSIYAYSDYTTYVNTNIDNQHNTIPRFQPTNQRTYFTYNINLYAYNPIDIIVTNATYWDIHNNRDLLKVTDKVDRRLADNYYKEFHDNHYICKNTQNKTLSLFIPSRIENDPKIYGFVGGTATEFYKMKSITYCGENYNFYTGTGNNWNGLDLWFQKK